ncbi:flagellar biosynthetic protein FliO [Anaeroselena agilis]|uniref:Flagellar protein n=1 Tax=Anaeroselena agilis TaxID=3063788 RepID=A0ABU3NWV8_9FIRM|nr:flagellar biosynthetic protein FliO [Selenomonadales bacterium 4137-cl]
MSSRNFWRLAAIVLAVLCLCGTALAAGQGGEYLSYQEPKPAGSSWLSTVAYVITLLVTFAVVIALAFFTSRFLGQRMGRMNGMGDNRVLVSLPLGQNRGVFVVEVAGKFLILGVTDHSVNFLQEITDPEMIDKLRTTAPPLAMGQFDTVFKRQLASLQQMGNKFPGVFGQYSRGDNEIDREKR